MTTNGTISQRKLVGYATNLEISDGDSAYDTLAEIATLIEAGTGSASFHLIWQMTVPAQQIIRWGSGSANQQRNQGFMSFNALDVGTGFEEGIVRLVVANARQTRSVVVREVNTQRLHTTTTTLIGAVPNDINQMVALPEQLGSPAVGEDSLLQIWFKTTQQTTTVDSAGFSIPSTIYQ